MRTREDMIKSIATFLVACFLGFSFFADITLAQIDKPMQNVKIDVVIKKAGYDDRIFSASTFKQQTNQTIVVLDGYDATLFVGERIPYARWFCRYLYENEYTAVLIDFLEVGSRLKVRPIIRGDMIEVTITPEISYRSDEGEGVITVDKLSTTVIVRNGQSIPIGGNISVCEFEKQFNEYFFCTERGEALEVILTPCIMEM